MYVPLYKVDLRSRQNYSKVRDAGQIHEVQIRIHDTKQDNFQCLNITMLYDIYGLDQMHIRI